MVNNKRRRNRRPRRRVRRQTSVLRNITTGLRGLQSVRSLTFAPKAIDTAGVVTQSWLEKAFPYMVIAMKFVGTLLKSSPPLSDPKTIQISSTIQSILIGAEDIMYDHPITEPKDIKVNEPGTNTEVTKEIMTCDYSMVRVTEIKIVISFMGSVGLRAGRLAACLIPLNYEKAMELNDNVSRSAEVVDFKQLTQKPGAIVSPNLRPLTIMRKTTGFTARRAMLGSPNFSETDGGFKRYPRGGLPLYELIVGYQDLAAAKADPKLTYSLEEATLCVEISGNLVLDAPVSSPRALRSEVRSLFSANSITAYKTGSRIPLEIPTTSVYHDGTQLVVRPDVEIMSE